MDALLAALRNKTGEVLKPHQTIHPITCNNRFTEALERFRIDRKRAEVVSRTKSFFGVSNVESCSVEADLPALIDALVSSTSEPTTNRRAASKALDYMEVYYEVNCSISSAS